MCYHISKKEFKNYNIFRDGTIAQPLTVSRVQLLYTVQEKRGKPDEKPYTLPYCFRNPYRKTSSLRTLKIMPRNLNEIVTSSFGKKDVCF